MVGEPDRGRWVGPVAGGLLALLALGPLLGRGYVLTYDMVFVPRLELSPRLLGLDTAVARSVPADLLVALAGRLVPADLVQKLVLAGVFLGAAAGAARLVPSRSRTARAAAAVLYAWNAFLYERLVMGHWGLLVSYAALPLGRARRPRPAGREGPLGPPPGPRPRHCRSGQPVRRGDGGLGRPGGRHSSTSAGCGQPNAPTSAVGYAPPPGGLTPGGGVPACRSGRGADRRGSARGQRAVDPAECAAARWRAGPAEGVEAFAARPDGPLGTLGSLVGLGGIWNALAVPPGLGTWPWLAGFLVVLAVAVAGLPLLGRRWPPGAVVGLIAVAGAGLLLAAAPALPGLRTLAELVVTQVPGAGLVRDSHKLVAPLALAEAVCFGLGVERVLAAVPPRWVRPAAVGLVAAPVLLLPALAWGAAGRLVTADYPPAFAEARAVMAADPVPGAVLILPWHLYQPFSWNGDRVVLDPARRWFTRRAVGNDDLELVGLTVPGEEPYGNRLGPLVRGSASSPRPCPAPGSAMCWCTGRGTGRPGPAAWTASTWSSTGPSWPSTGSRPCRPRPASPPRRWPRSSWPTRPPSPWFSGPSPLDPFRSARADWYSPPDIAKEVPNERVDLRALAALTPAPWSWPLSPHWSWCRARTPPRCRPSPWSSTARGSRRSGG